MKESGIGDWFSIPEEGQQAIRQQSISTTLGNARKALSEALEYQEISNQIQPLIAQLDQILQSMQFQSS